MMYAIIYVLLLTMSAETICGSPPPPHPPPPPSPPSDFALFVLQWPKGLCKATTCKKNVRIDLPASLNDFTLHGIWPMDANGVAKENCPPPFDIIPLQPLRGDLVTYWPSFKMPLDESFWRHEWEKHGSCSNQPLVMFFQSSINLAKTWCSKILTGLKSAGISPSATQAYTLKKYLDGIGSVVNPMSIYGIQCLSDSTKKKYLVEIRLCLDKGLKYLVACPKPATTQSLGCGALTDVALLYN